MKEIRDIIKNGSPEPVTVRGWVRSVRKSKAFSFVVLNDGTSQENLQIVVDAGIDDYSKLGGVLAGTCLQATGAIVESGGGGQAWEMQAQTLEVIGAVDGNYPLQKKATSLEFLREIAHLRPRTNLFGAVFRIRHALSFATHKFFNDEGFYYVHTPIITGIDAEGAGEMFQVTTMDLKKISQDDKGNVDFSKDYFGKSTSLTVSGQLEGECFAMGLGKIYTFGPTFRSENSNTSRHLAEFWMIEPEVAFYDLDDVAELASRYIQYLVGYALENCASELEFLAQYHKRNKQEDHRPILEMVHKTPFKKITYTEAVEILNASGKKFEFPTEWGSELQTEHERFLTEEHFKGPVTVTDYPNSFKPFYMKQNEDGKTVRAMDILVPGIGELVGGSQREDDLEKLSRRMKEMDMHEAPLWWYLDLRRFGSAPHSGFGLGFERAVMYVTGMKNIRDVIPFPRTPKSAEF